MTNGLFLVVFSTIIVTSAWLWSKHGGQLWRKDHLAETESVPNRPFGLLDVVLVFFIWGLVSIAALQVGDSMGWYSQPETAEELAELSYDDQTKISFVQGLGMLVATICGMLVVKLRYRGEGDLFGLRLGGLNKNLLLALVAFAMVFPILFGIQFICGLIVPYEHNTLELLEENFSVTTMFVTWFSAVLVAPVVEEVFFRGLLQAWLQRFLDSPNPGFDIPVLIGGWSSDHKKNEMASAGKELALPAKARAMIFWMPIFISSFLFAMAHFDQGLAPIPLFVFALVLGYLYRTTGSLIPCIALHLLLNGYTMFWLTMQLLKV